jgi:integrase
LLKFFYDRVLHWSTEDLERLRPKRKKAKRRPNILSVKDIERLLTWQGFTPKYRALFMTIYCAGLRIGEACRLKISDVKGDRNQLRIEQGKGKKDRYAVLFPVLLDELRAYWQLYRPEYWLFPSAGNGKGHFHRRIAQMTFQKACRALKLPKRSCVHTLRHCSATHCLEQKVDIRTLQEWMGHSEVETTCLYLHYVRPDIKNLKSPLDLIDLNPIKGRYPLVGCLPLIRRAQSRS